MSVLSPSALELLATAPAVVVAPVGIGFAQTDLEAWAHKTRRRILRDPAEFSGLAPTLILPQRRSDLERLNSSDPRDFLFLRESDLLFSHDEWQQAVSTQQTYAETGGWPEALALLQRIVLQPGESLVRHPLCVARLGSLLPKDIPREILAKAAQSPLLIPELYGLLGLDDTSVAELYDRGLLYAQGSGLAMPKLLRLYLRGSIPAEVARFIEITLLASGHVTAVLELLAEQGEWERYLRLLTETFSTALGNAYLREWLALVPPKYRDLPVYRYLATYLARFAGHTTLMEKELVELLPLADDHLRPFVLNAYGVSLGMQARYEEAIEKFRECLESNSSRVEGITGKVFHNMGVAFFHLGKLAQAQDALLRAASIYRQLGLFDQEAISLATLAPVELCLGNPREAISLVERALPYMNKLAAESYLTAENLAKAWIMCGDISNAERHLLELPEPKRDLRSHLVTKKRLGEVYLWKGRYAEAKQLVEEVLYSNFKDQEVLDDVHLLLSRIAFLEGKTEQARAHLNKVVRSVHAITESAWQGLINLDTAIAELRRLGMKFDLARLLLRKGDLASLREALELSRTYQYGLLLHHPHYAHLWRPLVLADKGARSVFPLQIGTFGSFEARLLGTKLDLSRFKTRKSAVLLTYMALHPSAHNRDKLAELFWSDVSNPLASLNTAVSELRKLFDAPIMEGNKGQVWLAFPVQTDLADFTKSTEPFLKQPLLDPNQIGRLEAQLARFDAPWLPDFPDWFDEERTFVEHRKAKLWRLLADFYATRAPHKAVAAYQRVTCLEPFNAEAWAGLMELYNTLGEKSLAEQAQAAMHRAMRELFPFEPILCNQK